MRVHRPSWCRFSDNAEINLNLRCLVRWMKRCTKHLLFVPQILRVLRLVESTRKPNLIDHRTDSKGQCCNKAHKHLTPSTELFCNTLTPFQADNCRNSEQRCSSKLQCSSGRVERFACTSSPTMADFPSAQELVLVASTVKCHWAASQALYCKPQAQLAAGRFDNKLELFEWIKVNLFRCNHKTVLFTEQKNRIGMGQKFYRQLQEILRQACIPNCNQAST